MRRTGDPADAVERATLAHLMDFGADVEEWLRERLAEQSAERGKLERDAARLRAEARKVALRHDALQRRLDSALDGYDDGAVGTALRQLERYDAERARCEARLADADAEAKVAEWSAEPDEAFCDWVRVEHAECTPGATLGKTLA